MLFVPGRAYDKYALFIKQYNGDWTLLMGNMEEKR